MPRGGCFEASLITLEVPRDDHPRQLVSKPLPCPLPSLLGRLILCGLFQDRALIQDREQLLESDIRNLHGLIISDDGCL